MSLTDRSARDLLADMATGGLTPSELMAATLERIAERNGELNAIVALRPEADLMDAARALDGTEPAGPLWGLPMAVKDLQATAGIVTTWGSPLHAGHVPDADDLLPARLRAAGAILIGKTNVPEFGLGSQTFNPVYGATRNPHDPARTCGGSSGGAAVALATGMTALADGSDMMGSLRNPAAWCGVWALRPSIGLVPETPATDRILHPVSTDGPMARRAGDLRLLLSVLSAPAPGWPRAVARKPAGAARLSGRRIGWLGDWGGAWPFEAGILETCRAALSRMEAAGAVVEEVAPPLPAEEIWQAWTLLRAVAVAAGRAGQTGDAMFSRMKPAAQMEVERGRAARLDEVLAASAVRWRLSVALCGLLGRFDALALPATQVWPFPVEIEHPTEIAGRAMDSYHRWMEVMVPVSLTGLPAVAVPAGRDARGLPAGLQIFGAPGADDDLIALAEGWEAAEAG